MRKDNKTLEDNLKRLHVLSGIKPINENKSGTQSTIVESTKVGKLNYALVKEGGYYYIKSTTSDVLNESSFDYIGGLANKKEFKFNSYADALKSLNLIKLNESEQGSLEELLSKDIDPVGDESQQAPPQQAAPAEQQPAPEPAPVQQAPAEQPAAPVADEFQSDEDQIDHFVGKLTAEVRKEGENLTGERAQGILKSIIAAIPLAEIEPEKRLEIAKRIKDGKQSDDSEDGTEAPADDFSEPAPVQQAPAEQPVNEGIFRNDQSQEGDDRLLNYFKEALQSGQNITIDEVKKAGQSCKLNEQQAMSVFYEAYTAVMSAKSGLQQVAESVNSKDDKKINEFFHNNRKNVVLEDKQLKIKNMFVETIGNKVILSTDEKAYEYNVSENTVNKIKSLLEHKKTQKLTEQITKSLKNI